MLNSETNRNWGNRTSSGYFACGLLFIWWLQELLCTNGVLAAGRENRPHHSVSRAFEAREAEEVVLNIRDHCTRSYGHMKIFFLSEKVGFGHSMVSVIVLMLTYVVQALNFCGIWGSSKWIISGEKNDNWIVSALRRSRLTQSWCLFPSVMENLPAPEITR